MVVDYLKRARRASPEIMLKAEKLIDTGYQKILTFERPGGGFDWWGSGPPLVWLTAYGMQQLAATAKVREIDQSVLVRARQFLHSKQSADGSWKVIGDTHSETISYVETPGLALTAYVAWSLAESGYNDQSVKKALEYLKKQRQRAAGNVYVLSLMANAFAFAAPQDPTLVEIFAELKRLKQEQDEKVWWTCTGKTATCAYGSAANVETTAMIAYAQIKAKKDINVAQKAIRYIVSKKSGSGTWGSTQATILALKALIASEAVQSSGGKANVEIELAGKKITNVAIDDDNRDVMRVIDLSNYCQQGQHPLRLKVQGNANIMYQVLTRYYLPDEPIVKEQPIAIDVHYDRRTLAKDDTIMATATMHYRGATPTFMVIVDLGIPPGFSIDRGDFAELLGDGKIERYSITSQQVTLYLGRVEPGQQFSVRYQLKAKYPLRVTAPKSTAYEYYSPDVRADSKPVELEVK